MPSERALSERHGVNRHAVREAIKRLQQAGLVDVNHGGATRVRDWDTTGGLDLLTDLGSLAAGDERVAVLRSAAEMRACIGADAARLCARRADARLRERIAAHAVQPPGAAPYEQRLEQVEALWELILAGAGNIAYRLAYNSLVAARVHAAIDPAVYADEVDDPDAIAAVADAIARGDEADAHATARALLDRTLTRLEGGRSEARGAALERATLEGAAPPRTARQSASQGAPAPPPDRPRGG